MKVKIDLLFSVVRWTLLITARASLQWIPLDQNAATRAVKIVLPNRSGKENLRWRISDGESLAEKVQKKIWIANNLLVWERRAEPDSDAPDIRPANGLQGSIKTKSETKFILPNAVSLNFELF